MQLDVCMLCPDLVHSPELHMHVKVERRHSGQCHGMGQSISQGADLCNLRLWVLRADISKTQDAEVGDGTTSVVVLAGELLREAEKLVSQKIHPMTIISGAECCCALLNASNPFFPHSISYIHTSAGLMRLHLA